MLSKTEIKEETSKITLPVESTTHIREEIKKGTTDERYMKSFYQSIN